MLPSRFELILIAAVAQSFATAQASPPAAGSYVNSDNSIELKARPDGNLDFSISGANAVADMCDANGVLDKATNLGSPVEEPKCQLLFEVTAKGVNVTSKTQDCAGLCGRSATLEGEYFKPDPLCDSLDTKLRDFKNLYDKKSFEKAYVLLKPLADSCVERLHQSRINEIYNNLAITAFHVGKYVECIKLAKLVEKTAPMDSPRLRELYADDARSAAFNRKKCEKAAKKSSK
jgi:hypothetical protein